MKALAIVFSAAVCAVLVGAGFVIGSGYEMDRMSYLFAERPDFKAGIEIGRMLAQPMARIELKPGGLIKGVRFESAIHIVKGEEAQIVDCEFPAVASAPLNFEDNVIHDLSISYCNFTMIGGGPCVAIPYDR